ncbi:unnamed protein product [Lepidochelys olivacea]
MGPSHPPQHPAESDGTKGAGRPSPSRFSGRRAHPGDAIFFSTTSCPRNPPPCRMEEPATEALSRASRHFQPPSPGAVHSSVTSSALPRSCPFQRHFQRPPAELSIPAPLPAPSPGAVHSSALPRSCPFQRHFQRPPAELSIPAPLPALSRGAVHSSALPGSCPVQHPPEELSIPAALPGSCPFQPPLLSHALLPSPTKPPTHTFPMPRCRGAVPLRARSPWDRPAVSSRRGLL